jgi:hypothetical protein
MTDCSIKGCPRPARARGWCTTHYKRWKRHGDPKTNLYARKDLPPMSVVNDNEKLPSDPR